MQKYFGNINENLIFYLYISTKIENVHFRKSKLFAVLWSRPLLLTPALPRRCPNREPLPPEKFLYLAKISF